MDEAILKIHGMTCGGCVNSVTRVLKSVPGVQEVSVSLDPGEARVGFDAAKADLAQLRKAIEDAGYEIR